MLQWIKRYYDIHSKGDPYDAIGRRKGQDLYLLGGDNHKAAPVKHHAPV